MIYKKLFEKSDLRPTEINNRLGLFNEQRLRFERSKKIELSKLVEFANALNVSKKELTDIVFEELSNMYKE
jgi:hypothetical protein